MRFQVERPKKRDTPLLWNLSLSTSLTLQVVHKPFADCKVWGVVLESHDVMVKHVVSSQTRQFYENISQFFHYGFLLFFIEISFVNFDEIVLMSRVAKKRASNGKVFSSKGESAQCRIPLSLSESFSDFIIASVICFTISLFFSTGKSWLRIMM